MRGLFRASKAAQAALEYIFTYGWAFLAILITIASLAYFGVFDLDNFRGAECNFSPGLICEETTMDNPGDAFLYVIMTNTYGVDLELKRFQVTSDLVDAGNTVDCEVNTTNNIIDPDFPEDWGNEETLRFNCRFNPNDYFRNQAYDFFVNLSFNQAGNSYEYNTTGSILLTVNAYK